jgi:energy-coupling factor transporter ATP-binding protein EcfA2
MPADEKIPPDAMHFRSLLLKNVRAFGSAQSLEFADDWNLILGENGVGKTTLMQALAVMWPTPTYASPADTKPTLYTPKLSEHEKDEDFVHFIRRGGSGEATMTAILTTDVGANVKVGVTIIPSMEWEDPLKEVIWLDDPRILQGGGPLVIGYGAARHVGRDNLEEVDKREATESLFGHVIDLYDAELIMEKLHHAALSDIDPVNGPDKRRLDAVKSVVAALLPGDLSADDIQVRGPRIAGRPPDQCGVHVRTPSGFAAFADLSLGYQTMFALTVDLAWRLFNAFPNSKESPLRESAIVLIDEVDLHMHPQWQRDLRRLMLAHFPRVQFIATTHSPVTAQEALSEGGNVVVVDWADGEAHIHKNPVAPGDWRSDQLLESELFKFGSDRSKQTEKKIYDRFALSQIPNRSPEQEEELRKLDEFVAALPTAPSPNIQKFEDLMISLAKDYPSGLVR